MIFFVDKIYKTIFGCWCLFWIYQVNKHYQVLDKKDSVLGGFCEKKGHKDTYDFN